MIREARQADSSLASRHARLFLALILISVCVSFSLIWIQEPILQRAIIVAGVCLSEAKSSNTIQSVACALFRIQSETFHSRTQDKASNRKQFAQQVLGIFVAL